MAPYPDAISAGLAVLKERQEFWVNSAQKICMIVGAGFAGIGVMLTVIFIAAFGGIGPFVLIPLFFALIGFCFIVTVLVLVHKKKEIVAKGQKYPAKIYSYVKNTSYRVNGVFPLNVKVHYFDSYGIEREVILPTSISSGADELFPIGMTVDIYEYKGKFSYDPASVRGERLQREEELMDNKPLDPEQLRLVAVRCPNCGSTYQAAAGYTGRCPYCGGYQNV